MSSKIDDVPQPEWIVASNPAAPAANHCEDALHMVEPVVERQPAYWEYRGTSIGDQIENRRMDCFWLNPNATHEHDYIKGVPLYRDPPELAELQATIARLTAENERLKGVSRPMAKYPNRLCHIDYTAHPYKCGCLKGDDEAQRIYFEHFKKLETDAQHMRIELAELSSEIERMKGGQGEPVSEVVANWSDWSMVTVRGDGVVRTYAEVCAPEQPAPVSVLKEHEFRELVNRLRDIACEYVGSGQLRERISIELRACLDKVKELNQ